ncbi:MAG: hydrolase [Bacteroidetes bacterium]|jgi:hydroxymethylpyrimidine pyrophosphatase-like HAD family hydrolase|nr:hydrolase [Bacteroidota bacterium]NBY30105.1 hydrolase [Sphingobacteriia bacterium]NDC72998.1 hydrolase [Sphingobacteriia bacterium]
MQGVLNEKSKTIAVDFDGTVVEHAYPAIGREMLFAFATLKRLQEKGHKLILWSIREGQTLQEAVDYCKANGVEFYAVNANFPGEVLEPGVSARKVNADIFIDDRNVGGFRGWSEIYQMLHPEDGPFFHQLENEKAHFNFREPRKKKGFWARLFGK